MVFGLFDCDELPDRIFAISPVGDISLLTADLEMKTSRPATATDNRVISAHVFSRSLCSFLKASSEGAVLVLLVEHGDSIQVEVYSVGTDDTVDAVVVHRVSLDHKVKCSCNCVSLPLLTSYQDIAATSFSSSGILNIICTYAFPFSLSPVLIFFIQPIPAIGIPSQLVCTP